MNRFPTFDEFQKTNYSRKQNDKSLEDCGAEIYINDLGQEKVRPHQEQIEGVREEMETEINNKEKMRIVSRTTMESHLENTNFLIQKIQRYLGVRVISLDLWEPTSEKLGEQAQEEARGIIEKIKTRSDKKTFLFQMAQEIETELNLNLKNEKSKNILVSKIVERGSRLKDEELTEMESALYLYGLIGKYKIFIKQNPDPLLTTIYAKEEMLRINKNFNLENTGFSGICDEIKKAYACLSLDLHTKPHYISISPAYQEKASQYYEILKKLSKVEAKDFLNHQDINLDKGFSNKEIH